MQMARFEIKVMSFLATKVFSALVVKVKLCVIFSINVIEGIGIKQCFLPQALDQASKVVARTLFFTTELHRMHEGSTHRLFILSHQLVTLNYSYHLTWFSNTCL